MQNSPERKAVSTRSSRYLEGDGSSLKPGPADLAVHEELREISRRIEDLAMQNRRLERELVTIRVRMGDPSFGAEPARTSSTGSGTTASRLGKAGREPIPELDRVRRKYRKLMDDPKRFVADSKKPWVRYLGESLLRIDAAARAKFGLHRRS